MHHLTRTRSHQLKVVKWRGELTKGGPEPATFSSTRYDVGRVPTDDWSKTNLQLTVHNSLGAKTNDGTNVRLADRGPVFSNSLVFLQYEHWICLSKSPVKWSDRLDIALSPIQRIYCFTGFSNPKNWTRKCLTCNLWSDCLLWINGRFPNSNERSHLAVFKNGARKHCEKFYSCMCVNGSAAGDAERRMNDQLAEILDGSIEWLLNELMSRCKPRINKKMFKMNRSGRSTETAVV